MYEDEGNFSAMAIDHPMNGQRYEATKKLADGYKQYYMPGQINPGHAAILQKVFVAAAPQETLQPGQGGGVVAVLDATLDGLNKYYSAKLEEKKQKEQIEFDKATQKTLNFYGLKALDNHTISATMKYNGSVVLKSLSLIGFFNDEQAAFNINSPINPRDKLKIQFEFKNAEINWLNTSNLKIGVGHAEWQEN